MRRADSASTIFAAAGCDADGGSVTGGTVDSELQRHSQHINSQIIQQYSDDNAIYRDCQNIIFPEECRPRKANLQHKDSK